LGGVGAGGMSERTKSEFRLDSANAREESVKKAFSEPKPAARI
jgi:hypothetical protein